MYWYLEVFRRYAEFSGRSRRKEYWMFALFNVLFVLGLAVVMAVLASIFGDTGIVFIIPVIILIIYFAVVFIPALAVTVRRLHDTGKSGWFILLNFIPYVGGLILFIFTVLDSEPGENQWGPNPKEDYVYDSDIDEIGMKEEF